MMPRSGADNPLIAELILDYREKHKTNVDRIRAMSDEELAEWISCNCIGDGYGNSEAEWLDWLQQEVNNG